MAALAIDGHEIGRDHPPFLIAEAGVNHNGNPALALRLVDAAARSGATAVKFQTFRSATLATADAQQPAYQRERAGAASQREMLSSLELSDEALRAAFRRARQRGMLAFSTPFDVESVDLLVGLGVPALKISSGDLTNLFLLRRVASAGVPILLSTGMATLDEVAAAIEVVRAVANPPLALLHCVSAYPAPIAEANLRAIPALRERFGLEVGFSDHTLGLTAPVAAVALGASIVEKHLTLDRRLPGPDHAASTEPAEFAALARALRDLPAALGDGVKRPQPSEEESRRLARRSLVVRRDLPAGAVLTESDLDARRPADGLSPLLLNEVLGRRLARDLASDSVLHRDDLVPPPGD